MNGKFGLPFGRRRAILAGLALIAVLPVLIFVERSDEDAVDGSGAIKVVGGGQTGLKSPGSSGRMTAMPAHADIRDALLTKTREIYPALRNVDVTCNGPVCTIEIASRGLVDTDERAALFGVVTGGLETALAKQGYTVGERSTAVYGDDTTVVTLRAAID